MSYRSSLAQIRAKARAEAARIQTSARQVTPHATIGTGPNPSCPVKPGREKGDFRGFAEELRQKLSEPRGSGEESGQPVSVVRAVVSVVRRLFF